MRKHAFANAEGCVSTLSRMRKGVLRKKRRKPRSKLRNLGEESFAASSPKKEAEEEAKQRKKKYCAAFALLVRKRRVSKKKLQGYSGALI